jgi:hypothetical protein
MKPAENGPKYVAYVPSTVLEWQMGHVGLPGPTLPPYYLRAGCSFIYYRNPARVFLRASARAYSHNTATRLPPNEREGRR